MQLPVFKRDITNNIINRLFEERHVMQVIVGPRQVGKTTAIHQALREINISNHYAAADLPAPPATEWITQQWDIARRKLLDETKVILVLDEIQKVSNWSIEVKRLWDEDTRLENNILVVLLGSSSLLIQKGLSESLAGRFEIIRFSHWSWKECYKCFNWQLDNYIYFGGYPGSAFLTEDEVRWGNYIRDSIIETAISKDILLLSPVEKPALLRQIFVLACEYGGQILSYQKLLGQLADAGNTTTLAHYQKLIESAFLVYGLQKWSGGMLRRRSSSPKWLPLNTALMTALSYKNLQEWRSKPERWGRLVEVAVGAHLVNEGIRNGINVYYWREGNYEVDFVLNKGESVIPIEVKSGRRHMSLLGFSLFKKKYKVLRTITVGATGIGLRDFLEVPVIEWFQD